MMSNWAWKLWVWNNGEQELWAQYNWHLSWGKPKPNLKECSAKEEEKSLFQEGLITCENVNLVPVDERRNPNRFSLENFKVKAA